ncbi:MAG TPA: cupin domain-containing protein [Solirubrobacteraceae bacterium]
MNERPTVNVFSVALEADASDPPGYRARAQRLGQLLEAEMLGATVYELDPGESICPYHYEHGNEEWLLVLSGGPVLRHPGGEDALVPGDLVCFTEGPEGAHKLTAPGDEPARLMMFSTVHDPAVVVYPDSGKVGVWPPGKLFRETDAVDYWEGELPVHD